MAVGLFTDRRMLEHRVPQRHPERPERLQAILRQLERTGYFKTCPRGLVREAKTEELTRVHSADYLRRVAKVEADGGGMLDPDTWVFPGSNLAARLAAGAAIEAVSYVMSGPDRRALCLVRPPGHHARPARGWVSASYANVAARRGRRTRTLRREPHLDRRLRRPPRQRHAGDLLRFVSRRVPVDPSLPVLSRARVRRTKPAPAPGWATP